MSGYEWLGVAIPVSAILWGVYTWRVGRRDKERSAVNEAQDRKIDDHDERIKLHSARLNKLDDMIIATREEMRRNHPDFAQLEKLEQQIRTLEQGIDQKLDKLHVRVGSLARDINRTIGALNQRHDSEITNLVEQIKHALSRD